MEALAPTAVDFWDARYEGETYAYGTEPNAYFRQQLDALPPGRLLLLAEGEGRNAVYAAKRGWQVTAVDFSDEGRAKALRLAVAQGVRLDYQVADLTALGWQQPRPLRRRGPDLRPLGARRPPGGARRRRRQPGSRRPPDPGSLQPPAAGPALGRPQVRRTCSTSRPRWPKTLPG